MCGYEGALMAINFAYGQGIKKFKEKAQKPVDGPESVGWYVAEESYLLGKHLRQEGVPREQLKKHEVQTNTWTPHNAERILSFIEEGWDDENRISDVKIISPPQKIYIEEQSMDIGKCPHEKSFLEMGIERPSHYFCGRCRAEGIQ